MNDSPFVIVIYLAVAGYVANMYYGDWKLAKAGNPDPKGMPGARSAGLWTYVLGVLGALLILGVETGGEIALGIASEQSEMIWYFVFASLAAGIVEEVIFRGYLVVENKGRWALIGSCIGFSLIFALIHGHFWSTEDGFKLTLTTKAFFSTGILLANSLWFYAIRFGPWNRDRSIFPCMLAHAASNLGVFVIKLVQGYVLF